jgi:hypothetical protein
MKLALLVLVLAGCGTTDPAPVLTVATTPIGTPLGDPVEMLIPTTGGSMTSADGTLRLDVPAGALAVDTTLTIQPITNEAPGGVGTAYRLGPEGQMFATPVTITFASDDASTNLGITYQDATAQWHSLKQVAHDAQSASAQTLHFSDWSTFMGFQLLPHDKAVKTGESVELNVVDCQSVDVGDDLAELQYECIPDPGFLDLKWLINGSDHPPASAGTISFGGDTATYTAPNQRPATNPVAVSTHITSRGSSVTLVSNITVGQPPLEGMIMAVESDLLGYTVTTETSVHLEYDDAYMAYVSTSGHVKVTVDVEGLSCVSHGVGEADIGHQDGYSIVDDDNYVFGGATTTTVSGTTTCSTSTMPYTATDSYPWWPALQGPFKLQTDGSMVGNVTDASIGEQTVTMSWALHPVAM